MSAAKRARLNEIVSVDPLPMSGSHQTTCICSADDLGDVSLHDTKSGRDQ
jgi:hypothetical protein